MKRVLRKLAARALLPGLILAGGCGSPGYNDNPSQRMAEGKAGCPAAADFLAAHFSVHVQPLAESGEARDGKALFRAYCHDIPAPGKVFFTIDLAGLAAKKTPLALRAVEEEPQGFAADARELRALAEIPPQVYSKGFIEGSFLAEHSGHYAVYLFREGPGQERLKIPLRVGLGAGAAPPIDRDLAGGAAAFGLLLALVGFAAFRLRKAPPANGGKQTHGRG